MAAEAAIAGLEIVLMSEDLKKFAKEVDALAARLNAGLGAVAVALSVVFGAALTVKLAQLAQLGMLDAPGKLLLGP
jgi:hypothetical protein